MTAAAQTRAEPYTRAPFYVFRSQVRERTIGCAIEKVFDTPQEIVITVRPTYDPTAEDPGPKTTSHFFTAESTNNFSANIKGKTVNAYVIGLNEKQNTAETDSMLEAARNVAAANIGSYLGIQKGEWTTFCKTSCFPKIDLNTSSVRFLLASH